MSGRLILLRHGESVWNHENRFTGWTDVDLTQVGIDEAEHAAALLRTSDLCPDIAITSVLVRAIRTLWIVLERLDLMWLDEVKDWRLNERHYGSLQGRGKAETAQEVGEEQVFHWRRDFRTRPPLLDARDPRHPRYDPRYAHLDPAVLPGGESLHETLLRVMPCWQDTIRTGLADGRTLLVVAHHNSLRALVKHLENIDDREISTLNIPTGYPLVYEFRSRLRVAKKYYLGDENKIQAAADAVYRIPESILDRYLNSHSGE